MKDFCISAIQMVSGSDVAENLARARVLTKEAVDAGAQLVLLPEYFAHLAEGGSRAVAEPFSNSTAASEQTQPIQWALQNWARELDIWIAAGAMPLLDRQDGNPVAGQRTRSAFLLYDDQGALRVRYDKMHLFDVEVDDAAGSYRESNSIEPGDTPCVASTPWAALGLSICFDLRFPELYRQLAVNGAEVLMVPAAFTHTTGQAHWKTLLQARAIENGCFVVAANQGGQHSEERRTWGHSMIIDPWGDIIAEAGEGEAVVTAKLNASTLEKIRKKMPILSMGRL